MTSEPHNGESDQNSAKDTNGMSNIKIKQGLEQPPMKRDRTSHWGEGYELNNGRFVIKKVLGEGGFGVTYLAEDRNINNRLVVIKTLNEKVQKGDQDLFHKLQQDFKDEARRLDQCKHQNIVTIYDRFAEEKTGLECIVMEYIPGQTLKDRVGDLDFRGAYMEEEEALGYIHQIAKALEVIHRQNMVHRDVKPGNIMIRKGTREVVLIDFGIAREFNKKDIPQTAYVSQNYAPLEQSKEFETKGPFTDVYALGATLYFLLTKKAPEDARDRADSLSMHDKDPLKPPQEINRQISDRTNDAILKTLELAPRKRPQNVREFLSLLGLEPSQYSQSYSLLTDENRENQPVNKGANIHRRNYRQILELLWRTALIAAGIWLLAIALFKAQGNPRFGIGVLVGVSLVVIAQVKNRSSLEQKIYQLIIAGLPTVGMLLVISPANVSFSTIWWLTIAVSGFAILMMLILQKFIAGD